MNRERLETLKRELAVWASAIEREALMHLKRQPELNMYDWRNECGTTCCALGYAAQYVPEFQAAGLVCDPLHGHVAPFIRGRRDNGAIGFVAAREFFDLDAAQTQRIFDAHHYGGDPQISDVIAHIDEVLEATC